jgi:hypothetical protein
LLVSIKCSSGAGALCQRASSCMHSIVQHRCPATCGVVQLLTVRPLSTVDLGTPSYEFTVNICTYLIL